MMRFVKHVADSRGGRAALINRRKASASAGLLLESVFFFAFAVGCLARAQDSTQATLPLTPEQVSRAAEHLIGSGGELKAAEDRISKQGCVLDRELTGLGAGLQEASDALKAFEPSLLSKQQVDLTELFDKSTPAVQAARENLQHSMAYRADLDSLAQAGRRLAALDPIGTSGPPPETGQLLVKSGQGLIDLNEKSGIGLYFRVMGEALETFRIATLKYDKISCASAARSLGQMAGLSGETLNGLAAILQQSLASSQLGLSLFEMSSQVPNPSLNQVRDALELYGRSLFQLAQSLANRADIARALSPPQPAVVSLFEDQSTLVRRTATNIDEARKLLTHAMDAGASPMATASAMQLVGAKLQEVGVFATVIETGSALVRAGRLLSDRQSDAAATILRESGLRVVNGEKSLVQEP